MKILRWILQGQTNLPLDPDFRKSYRAVARDLDVDEGTVRNRIKRFHETGFAGEWHLIANPNLWGGGHAVIRIDVPASLSKQEIVERLKLVPGVFYLTQFVGSLVEIFVVYEDEQSIARLVELVRRISGAGSAGWWNAPFPRCDLALTPQDWRLVRSLSESPRKPYVAIARELGVSSRTVKRRVLRLSREGALFAFPALNPAALQGTVMAVLFISHDPRRKEGVERAIGAQLDPYLWHTFNLLPAARSDAVPCIYNLMLPNVAVAGSLLRKARELEGVREARADLVEEAFVSSKPLDDIARRAAMSSSPRNK